VQTVQARERVVTLLTRQFADDALSEAELEARLARVYAAATPAELDAILAELPVPGPTSTSDIRALLSGQERKWTGAVPPLLTLHARLGYVELDLTGARFEASLTTIDVRAFLGYVQLRLPASVRVESSGRATLGFFALKGTGAGGGPVVRITGRAALGFAEAIVASGP
jgi:Domain of unknown function (DUF1707)